MFDVSPAGGTTADLFGFAGAASLTARVRRYFSGVAAPAIWRGYTAARAPVCVAVADVGEAGIERMLAYLRDGGQVLVDSGAFIYRDRPEKMPWSRVVGIYERAAAVGGGRAELVLPDQVGDQDATLRLLEQFAPAMRRCRYLGARVLLPIQRGARTPAAFAEAAIAGLGWMPDGYALPSAAAALLVEDVRALASSAPVPRRVHFLGISRRAKPLAARLMELLPRWPDVDVSVDAVEHRAHVGARRGRITRARAVALRQIGDEVMSDWDDTEDDTVTDLVREEFRARFPTADEETLDDLVCSGWGDIAGWQAKRVTVERERGPDATAASIEAFAREALAGDLRAGGRSMAGAVTVGATV